MKFSIITVNYNNNKGLKKTIVSVLAQTCLDYEYIIIDGGSCDGSKETIEQHADKIDYWVSEPDKGIYNAMNKGIKVAKGDYLIFMNSGDCFYDSNVLQNVYREMKEPCDIVAGGHISKGKKKASPQQVTATYMFYGTLCHQAVFIKRSMFAEEQYDEQYKLVADWVHLFNMLILNDAIYQHIDFVISKIERDGVSMVNWKQLEDERKKYLKATLPRRIYEDFKLFQYAKALDGESHNIFKTLNQHHFVRNELRLTNFILSIFVRIKHII